MLGIETPNLWPMAFWLFFFCFLSVSVLRLFRFEKSHCDSLLFAASVGAVIGVISGVVGGIFTVAVLDWISATFSFEFLNFSGDTHRLIILSFIVSATAVASAHQMTLKRDDAG
jgi:hypothetical protein